MLLREEKVAIVILVIIVLALAGFFGYKFYEKKQKEEMFEGMSKGKLTTLLDRKIELETEIEYLNSEMEYNVTGSLVVLFAQPASKLEDEVIPQMKKKKYDGVIAVSEKYFPGDENCLSVKKTKELLDEGWELTVSCTKSTDIAGLCSKIEKAGLGKPAAAYYPSGRTRPNVDALKDQGITNIIRYNITSENYLKDSDDSTIDIMCFGCNAKGRGDRRKTVMSHGETFVYEIGFLNERNQCSDFKKWVGALEKAAAEEEFEITNITDAVEKEKSNIKTIKKDNGSLYDQREKDIEELRTVNEEIKAVEKEYREKDGK